MKKGTSNHPEVFMALAQAYESGNTTLTERIESILTPDAFTLPEVLQNALDKFGDTPIAEPVLYKALQEQDMGKFADLCSVGIAIDEHDAVTSSTFIARVRNKILTRVDKDGVFKTTPMLEKMCLPTLSAIRNFSEVNQGKTSDTLETELMKLVGLVGVELSLWEKELVNELGLSYAQATTDALLGRVTDRTPFARYLKNK